MSERRRGELIDIARRYGVLILEDDAASRVLSPAPTAIASLAPEITFHIADPCYGLCPILRHTYICCPEEYAQEVQRGVRATVVEIPPLDGAVITHWIREGISERLLEARRTEFGARAALAKRAFGDAVTASVGGEACWVRLPSSWRPDDFVREAGKEGLFTRPASFYSITGGAPNAARIRLVGRKTTAELGGSLDRLAALLRRPPPVDVLPG